VAILRTEAGRDPYDRILQDLIGELSTRSDEFRTRWGAHDVRRHSTGVKQFRHPIVGDISLSYEAMEMSADTGLTLYNTPPHPALPPGTAFGCSRAGLPPRTRPNDRQRT
jgi:hypothetical protein